MPIVTCQNYILSLLDGLVWPTGLVGVAPLEAYITPPDPKVDNMAGPAAYIWPSHGNENRNPDRGGTIPRANKTGDPSGLKTQMHDLDIFLRWYVANNDPDADNLFPACVDWVMATLRNSPDATAILEDPYNPNTPSYLIDVGEVMTYEIALRATVDERTNMYDAQIVATINEVFPS
jgi:hypothetical protein